MTDGNSRYDERLNRIVQAITLKKPDRIPVIAMADTFCATHQGAKMSKFSNSPWYSVKVMRDTFLDFPTFDGIEVPYAAPKITANAFMTKVKLAGVDLPEDTPWQIDEREYMTVEDYDFIIDKGWPEFIKMYNKRIGFSSFELLQTLPTFIFGPKIFKKAGFTSFSTAFSQPPIELFASGRSLSKFMIDMFRIPDKVEAAMDVALEFIIEDVTKQISRVKPLSVFIFNARGSNHFISPKLFDRFSWPYLSKLTKAVTDAGSYANLHCDGKWDNALEYFKDLPKGKCIFAADSSTDMIKTRDTLQGHMCIKGDVSSTLLTMDTPDGVYKYTSELIEQMGPTGFILSPGCTIPPDAKPENIKAMLAAISGKQV